MKKITLIILTILTMACFAPLEEPEDVPVPDNSLYNTADVNATNNTKILYKNLADLGSKYMFGQANARNISASYSGAKNWDLDQSDCKDITESHPAFIESDFMWYDYQQFEESDIEALKLHYKEGGVIGYAWHFRDPSGSFYTDTTNSNLVKNIISNTNGKQDWFYGQIDEFVLPALSAFSDLDIPLILRPFHEMNGGWFWWGDQTTSNYIALYKLFVDYLRDTKGLHNILYAWSPNVDFETSYYPGDDYVDIVGLDYYEPTYSKLASQLKLLVNFANSHSKVAAFTETGYRSDGKGSITSKPKFWTEDVMAGINSNIMTSGIAYVMSWYNANWSSNNLNAYTPYDGIENTEIIDDFINFKDNDNVLFLDELPEMY